MEQQGYNFFGLGPAQQQASQDPALLAQQMALQEYNNPTNSQSQTSQNSSGINPQSLAKMMMSHNGDTGVPASVQAQGIPSNAQSWNTGAGPLPWLPKNALPWGGR